jgi:hypothetical protein
MHSGFSDSRVYGFYDPRISEIPEFCGFKKSRFKKLGIKVSGFIDFKVFWNQVFVDSKF